MNEDARDTDTPTGRALGTVAVLGLSAAGVGLGAYGTYKTAKAVGQSVKKGVGKVEEKLIEPIRKKATNKSFSKVMKNTSEALADEGIKLENSFNISKTTQGDLETIKGVVNEKSFKNLNAADIPAKTETIITDSQGNQAAPIRKAVKNRRINTEAE